MNNMAHERNTICRFYECKGVCSKGKKECRIWNEMQTCPFYEKKKGAKPIRTNNKRKKVQEAKEKDRME